NIVDTRFFWARSFDLMSSDLIHAHSIVTAMHWSPSKKGWIKLITDGALPSVKPGASIGR
ncbi:hypothetical protein J1N35_001895, partial [Gossypium stocksii]